MSLRRLSRNAGAGVIQVLLSAIVMFELYRFLARELGAAQIGAWSVVLASASVTRLAELGMGGGIVRFVAGDLGEGSSARAASTAGMTACIVALIVGLACLGAAIALPGLLWHVVSDASLVPFSLWFVPWALLGLWCGSLANVFLSVLDACQRSTLRAAVLVGASVLQLGMVYLFVPEAGVMALGPIYLAQSTTTLLAALVLAHLVLGQPLSRWLSFDWPRARELARYGGSLQLATLGQVLFDPVTKVFMARFGGMAATGYFEMASRAVMQLRAVIVSAYQALVPYVASRAGNVGLTPTESRSIYLPAYRLLFIAGTPYFSVLGTALPLLLTLWLGGYNALFLSIGFICLAGWYANTLSVPAYMLCLAVGQVRWVMWSHLVMGILNVILSWVGGAMFGAIGVAAGAMIALALGSALVQVAVHSEYHISQAEVVPSASGPLLGACACAVGWAGYVALSPAVTESLSWVGVGTMAAAASCGALVVRHPFAKDLFMRVRSAT